MINAYVDSNIVGILNNNGVVNANISNKRDIAIEFVDAAPLTAHVVYSGEEVEISIFVRDEMHTDSRLELHGIVKNGTLEVDEGDEETVRIAFAAAEAINKAITDNGLEKECDNLDEDKDGLLLSEKDGELTVKIVSGKKRPNLLCTTLFGAPRMIRPYTDEIMSQFAMNSLSREEMEEAANAGDPDAMEQLAMAYLNGDDEIEEDPEKAYYWYVKCAEAGNDQAMFNVGLFTAKGFGTDRNFEKAAEWMQKAADEGDEDAEVCATNYRKMADALIKANDGDAQAQADLARGLMQLGGSLDQAGEGKDFEESVMWAEKAVAQGHPDGYWTLALAYRHGRGVRRNMKKAIELYQKGADAGNASCQHNLGCEYMSGTNVKKDLHKGFELIKAAAEQGNGLAMRDLGRCYQFANGTPGNMKTAIEWYEKALEIIDDPELERKTANFKMIADMDPQFGEDYPESSDEESDMSDLTDELIDAVKAEIESKELNSMENSEVADNNNNDSDKVNIENLSPEEMREKLQTGEGVIKQIIKSADGTEKEVPIWGGYELDGFDRTLNVFMNFSDIGRFSKIIIEEEISTEGIEDPCKNEIGYQMTVDFLDTAITSILRKGLGRLEMEMYVRDERKTGSNIMSEGCGTIELVDGDNLSINREFIEQNKFVMFGIAYLGLRKYLLKEGIVQELYRMYDESAGVFVKVGKAGTITTKIVRGMERPDLPCDVFLLGTQTCRPYIDEMLGLKSSGIRKPFDPVMAEKMKAAEKERLRRKAEEEEAAAKDRAEAEAKATKEREEAEARAAQERAEAEAKAAKEKAEAEERMNAAMEAWHKEVDSINLSRERRKNQLLREYEIELRDEIEKMEDEWDDDRKRIEKAIDQKIALVKNMNEELKGLGILRFGRKKELNGKIDSTNSEILDLKEQLKKSEAEYNDTIANIKKEVQIKKDKVDEILDKAYLIPDSPIEIEKKRLEEERRRLEEEKERKRKEEIEASNAGLKDEIVSVLACSSKPMSIMEIVQSSYVLQDMTPQRMSALLTQLVKAGKINKTYERKMAYFSIV